MIETSTLSPFDRKNESPPLRDWQPFRTIPKVVAVVNCIYNTLILIGCVDHLLFLFLHTGFLGSFFKK
jgi:hypothetical protein